MKKAIMGMAVLAMVAGCTPTAEQIKSTATAIGYAAGLVANETPIKDNARNAVVEVLNEVRTCIPTEGQSFEDAWAPIIKEKVAALVASGKIDAATGTMVIGIALIAAQGVDYMFDVRYPQAKKYAELVEAGASGAIDRFLEVFKPVNECEDCTKAKRDYDKDAYEWFQKNLKK